ncbi:hypothetical protein IGI04_021254 [Brassica rapa subsp. trilocularis]|uniref:WRKY domain-containing protein n=2 Tax=Brassica TaxID=3705 RepID=A0ABQ8CVA8_BRANA|nr:hypothetical protein IGI04_021254 [Brassica rapa subsp. trilocularis]KAH0920528.1 hypothetical protein HID58_020546 [Brassica napus]
MEDRSCQVLFPSSSVDHRLSGDQTQINTSSSSYYKCTEKGCRVKKQVQRLSGDEGVVVTTYQGVHTHPVDTPSDNFHHILTQMHIFPPF